MCKLPEYMAQVGSAHRDFYCLFSSRAKLTRFDVDDLAQVTKYQFPIALLIIYFSLSLLSPAWLMTYVSLSVARHHRSFYLGSFRKKQCDPDWRTVQQTLIGSVGEVKPVTYYFLMDTFGSYMIFLFLNEIEIYL